MQTTRLTKIAAGFVLGALTAAVIFSQIELEFLTSKTSTMIEASTGLSAHISGNVRLSLLPHPHIIIKNVTLKDEQGFIQITSPLLNAHISVLALFSAKTEVSALDFQDAELSLMSMETIKTFQPSNWLKAHPLAMASGRVFPLLSFIDATAVLKETAQADPHKIDHLNFSLDWSGPGSPALLSGRAMLKEQRADFQLWVDRPSTIFQAGQSEASLTISVGSTQFALNGHVSGENTLQFSGRETVNIAKRDDLPPFLERFALSPCLAPPYSFKSDAVIGPDNVALGGIQLDMGKNQFEGILAYQDNGPRPVLSGTLAINALNLDIAEGQLAGSMQILPGTARSEQDRKAPAPCNYDLRLSANSLRYGILTAENAAFSILSRNNKIDVTLADLKLFDGMASGRFTYDFEMGSQDPAMKLTLQIRNLQTGRVMRDGLGSSLITGSLSGSMNLETSGTSVSSIIQHLTGQADIRVDAGRLTGLDMEQILRRMEKHPLPPPLENSGDTTNFDRATLSITLADGMARLSNGIMVGPGSYAAFDGTVNFLTRTLHLNALASQPTADGMPRKDGTHVQMTLDGPWNGVTITPIAR